MLSITHAPGTDRVIKSIMRHAQIVKGAARKTFRQHRPELKSEAKRLMELPKSGKVSKVYVSKRGGRLKRGRVHVASRRGEPFALLSGDTLRSMAFKQRGWSSLQFGFGTFQGGFWERNQGRTVLHKARVGKHQQFVSNLEKNIIDDIMSFVRGK